jgi:hypothetical protein
VHVAASCACRFGVRDGVVCLASVSSVQVSCLTARAHVWAFVLTCVCVCFRPTSPLLGIVASASCVSGTFSPAPMHTTSIMLRPESSLHTCLLLTFDLPTLRTTLRTLPCSSDFQRMCDVVGVDALASQKGFWSEMFGVGDFYYKLGVSIVDVCLSTRGKNGGIMPIEDLLARVEERSGCVHVVCQQRIVCECCSFLAHARGFLLGIEHMQQQATCAIFLCLCRVHP